MWASQAEPAFNWSFLVALEKVVASCLLGLLQSLRCAYTHTMLLGREFQGFDPVIVKERWCVCTSGWCVTWRVISKWWCSHAYVAGVLLVDRDRGFGKSILRSLSELPQCCYCALVLEWVNLCGLGCFSGRLQCPVWCWAAWVLLKLYSSKASYPTCIIQDYYPNIFYIALWDILEIFRALSCNYLFSQWLIHRFPREK